MTLNDFLIRKFQFPLMDAESEGGSGGGAAGESGTSTDAGGGGTLLGGSGDSSTDDQNSEGDKGGEPKTLLGAEGGDKSGDGGSGEEFTPLTSGDLKVPEGAPEGTEFGEELTSFLDIMNNRDLSPAEQAQKLIDLQFATQQSSAEAAATAATEAWGETVSGWEEATKALPEIGGDKLDESLAQIKKGLDASGATPETYAALDITGAGSHPEIVKLLHTLTKNLGEGGSVAGSPAQGNLSQADRLFAGKSE